MYRRFAKPAVALFLLPLLLLGGPGVARAELKPTTLAAPQRVEFALSLDEGRPIRGELLKYDAKSFRVKVVGGVETEYKWAQLSWVSEYALRAQLVDKTKAGDWLDLAEVAVKNKVLPQVKPALDAALKLDPSVKPRADAITKSAAARATAVKFQKATNEQSAAAIAKAKERAAAVAKEMGLELTTIETMHFLVFTDWRDHHDVLKKLCEESYSAVSSEFNIPAWDNVFVGKLPVFMFAKREKFVEFALTFDGFAKPVSPGLLGYCSSREDGTSHMAMYRPDRDPSENDPDGQFAHTLMHEFTHAFVARYRTNRRVPRWLNEGLAEYVSYKRYPRKGPYPYAKYMAGKDFNFEAMFDDSKMPSGELYPVMQTMVEALVNENARGFIQMFNDVKDGMEPEAAIKRQYKAGYQDFEKAWRRYAKGLKTPYKIVDPGK